MKFTVYILKSIATNKYYIGQTHDLKTRLIRHNAGKNKSTKYAAPWACVYREEYDTRSEAFAREQQIKRYKGGVAFKKLLG